MDHVKDPESDEPSAETDRSDSQHQAEKLELENKMLRGVLDSMADNISIKDLKGRYIFDNSAHCRFLGATKTSEVVGKTVFDFLPSDIAAKFYAEDLQVLQSGEPLVRCVDPSVDSAGNRVWMSVTKMPLRDEDGSCSVWFPPHTILRRVKMQRSSWHDMRRSCARKMRNWRRISKRRASCRMLCSRNSIHASPVPRHRRTARCGFTISFVRARAWPATSSTFVRYLTQSLESLFPT